MRHSSESAGGKQKNYSPLVSFFVFQKLPENTSRNLAAKVISTNQVRVHGGPRYRVTYEYRFLTVTQVRKYMYVFMLKF